MSETVVEQKAKAKVEPVSAPAVKASKPVQWKLVKGRCQSVPMGGGQMLDVTNDNVNDPAMIAAITKIEAMMGRRLFGVVFVQK